MTVHELLKESPEAERVLREFESEVKTQGIFLVTVGVWDALANEVQLYPIILEEKERENLVNKIREMKASLREFSLVNALVLRKSNLKVGDSILFVRMKAGTSNSGKGIKTIGSYQYRMQVYGNINGSGSGSRSGSSFLINLFPDIDSEVVENRWLEAAFKPHEAISGHDTSQNFLWVYPLSFPRSSQVYAPQYIGVAVFNGLSSDIPGENVINVLRKWIPLLWYIAVRRTVGQILSVLEMFAVKSALSAIMSRNLSHNIGSHVLSRLASELDLIGLDTGAHPTFQDPKIHELKDRILWAFLDFHSYMEGSALDDIRHLAFEIYWDAHHHFSALTTKAHKEKTIQLTNLLQYLQVRQDFIAQIATDWPAWGDSLFLLRHLVRDFLAQELFLDYVAAGEGLRAFKSWGP